MSENVFDELAKIILGSVDQAIGRANVGRRGMEAQLASLQTLRDGYKKVGEKTLRRWDRVEFLPGTMFSVLRGKVAFLYWDSIDPRSAYVHAMMAASSKSTLMKSAEADCVLVYAIDEDSVSFMLANSRLLEKVE
jgi:hypothetical protein